VSYWIAKYNSIWHDWHRDADDSTVVHNSGNEVVAGSKSFSDVLTALAGIKGDVTGSLKGNADTATRLAIRDTLADSTDLNTIQTAGLYQWFGATFINGPIATASYGHMNVTVGGNVVIQTFYINAGNVQQVYYRTMSGAPRAWNDWQKVIFTNDKIANATHADTAETVSDTTVVHTGSSPTFGDLRVNDTVKSIGLELSHTTPFVDFHFNNDASDYTSRIIEDALNTLSVYKGPGALGTLRAGTFEGYLNGKAASAGNADKATKLQTPRNINGVGFDGSSDVTVNPVLQNVDPNTDLSTLPNGYYFFPNAPTAPNKPAGAGNWFTVEVVQIQLDGFMRLVDSGGASFWRAKSSGKWQSWHQYAEKADMGLAYTVTKTF
jgi:hypothetical protein